MPLQKNILIKRFFITINGMVTSVIDLCAVRMLKQFLELTRTVSIIGGGEMQDHPNESAFTIAVNSGLWNCYNNNITPKLLILDAEIFSDSDKIYRIETQKLLSNYRDVSTIVVNSGGWNFFRSALSTSKNHQVNVNRVQRAYIVNKACKTTALDLGGVSKVSTGAFSICLAALSGAQEIRLFGISLFSAALKNVPLHPFDNTIPSKQINHLLSDSAVCFILAVSGIKFTSDNEILQNIFNN